MRTAIMTSVLYLLVATMVWCGLHVFANSYNAMNKEHIQTLTFTVTPEKAEANILTYKAEVNFQDIDVKDDIKLIGYMLASKEVKLIVKTMHDALKLLDLTGSELEQQ
jgi:hypothetical protein